MAITDERTPRLNLPLPYSTNALKDDVERLRESFTTLDGKVATLDAGGKILADQIPSIAISDTYTVASESAMLALPANKGDVAIRSDIDQSFILSAEPASTLSNWKELLSRLVSSVNGQAGAVVIDAEDVSDSRGKSLQVTADRVNSPYAITGRANIRNPVWNAPIDNASDPAAASANAAAINMMLSSGNKRVELDDVQRYVNSTLIPVNPVTIVGAGRSAISLVWNGDGSPIIARANYADRNAAGISNIRLQDLRITDLATDRPSWWSIDLTNGNSNGMEGCQLDGRATGGTPSDRFGIALGAAEASSYSGSSFVVHMRDSRLAAAKLMVNTTDWYIRGCELWGNNRDRAVSLGGGGTVTDGTQIVPGSEAGIFIFNDNGYDLDTLKLIGVYFDGSYQDVFTGWGIKSANNIGIVGSEIIGCNFWHLNQGGIYITRAWNSTIMSNFRDCDSDDTGEDDIIINDVTGCYIYNRHFRTTAPKTGNTRANLGRPYSLTGHQGFPLTAVGGNVGYSGSYGNGLVNNREVFEQLGGSNKTKLQYLVKPTAGNFTGDVLNINGRPEFSDGSRWTDLSNDAKTISTATDFDSIVSSGAFYVADLSLHTHTPGGSGSSGPGMLEVIYINNTYTMQRLTSLATGAIFTRYRSNGSWGSYNTNA